MNTFLNLQPTIIKASYNEDIPENIRGRFFVNFNVIGIKNNDNSHIYDIPRIYICINDEFVSNSSNFNVFVNQILVDNSSIIYGVDNFLPGVNYFINETLYDYLLTFEVEIPENIVLEDYIDENLDITKYWEDISNESYSKYIDISYFNGKNKLFDNTFSEEDLNNFYSTFCRFILELSNISDDLLVTGNNMIYKQVLGYYLNFMEDAGSISIANVLNSLYSVDDNKKNCGCNTEYNQSSLCLQSCYELYKTAMNEWLVKMLSDYNFYNDWFLINISDDSMISNDVLIDNLIQLITEFKNLNYLLEFNKKTTGISCSCPNVSFDENSCNYEILDNYIELLNYVKDLKINENKNKIKIYGENFAKILPLLQF